MTLQTTNNQHLQVQSNSLNMPTFQELHQLTEFCKLLATSPFYQKMGPGGVMAIYLTARELKLPFMTCLNGGLYTFDGKVTMSAQLMNMMIVQAGHRADVLTLTDQCCKLRFWRCDRMKGLGDVMEYDFTIEMAQRAGYLSKDNWKKSPRDMLYSRALSGGARKFMPDVLMNCYVFGEIEDAKFSDAHLTNVPPAEIVAPPEPTKEITHVEAEGFNNFVSKHKLFIEEDQEFPKGKYLFMIENCTKHKKTSTEMINAFIRNEDLFEKRYLAWKALNEAHKDLV